MAEPIEPAAESDALAFLEGGIVPGVDAPTAEDRIAFLRRALKVAAFKERAWPHFACFVDASNVARRRRVDVTETTVPKARLADLDAVVDLLRKKRYVPLVVSDGNLFQLMDDPYAFRTKYMGKPHSVAERRQADGIVLQALKRLPEAACVSNDRFSKPEEQRFYAEVVATRDFYRHRWDGDEVRLESPDGNEMPGAFRRMVSKF